jgi:hypothetical protein
MQACLQRTNNTSNFDDGVSEPQPCTHNSSAEAPPIHHHATKFGLTADVSKRKCNNKKHKISPKKRTKNRNNKDGVLDVVEGVLRGRAEALQREPQQ